MEKKITPEKWAEIFMEVADFQRHGFSGSWDERREKSKVFEETMRLAEENAKDAEVSCFRCGGWITVRRPDDPDRNQYHGPTSLTASWGSYWSSDLGGGGGGVHRGRSLPDLWGCRNCKLTYDLPTAARLIVCENAQRELYEFFHIPIWKPIYEDEPGWLWTTQPPDRYRPPFYNFESKEGVSAWFRASDYKAELPPPYPPDPQEGRKHGERIEVTLSLCMYWVPGTVPTQNLSIFTPERRTLWERKCYLEEKLRREGFLPK